MRTPADANSITLSKPNAISVRLRAASPDQIATAASTDIQPSVIHSSVNAFAMSAGREVAIKRVRMSLIGLLSHHIFRRRASCPIIASDTGVSTLSCNNGTFSSPKSVGIPGSYGQNRAFTATKSTSAAIRSPQSRFAPPGTIRTLRKMTHERRTIPSVMTASPRAAMPHRTTCLDVSRPGDA